MTNTATEQAYDAIPYPSYPFPETHPDRLATVATLLGMQPAPVERCRVLELGCAAGGNLIPMAYTLPDSQFVGVDLSARQIAAGQPLISALGLKNISLQQLDLLEVGPEFGLFDYIIAHGVYSWVPPDVQTKLLQICRENLAPNGVAYVSYNTYPGWRIRGVIREMMLFHLRHIAEPQARLAGARELLDFLAGSIQAENNIHGDFLRSYVNYVRERLLPETEDAYLFHEELAGVNEPLYFYQFVERITAHGLQYLGEAQFQTMLAGNFPAEVVQKLRAMAATTVALEQYMDFLRNRTFRRSLLCHREVRLSGRLAPERLGQFYLASPAKPESKEPVDLNSDAAVTYRGPDGKTLTSNHPLTKAAMSYLAEIWPQVVSFAGLVAAASRRLGEDAAGGPATVAEVQLLGANLLQAYGVSDNLVEFHVYGPHFVTRPGPQPTASAVARWLAERGPEVTNLRHEPVRLHPFIHHLVRLLDGHTDRPALLQKLAELLAAGMIQVEQNDRPVEDLAEARKLLPEMLESSLQAVADAALLVS